MDDLFMIFEYLVMGGMLSFLLITVGHFSFIVPRVAPNRSESTCALHQMLCLQFSYNAVLYILWLLPVFVLGHPIDFYLEDETSWSSYYMVMDYLDMTILPVGLLLGHTVTRGKLPPFRLFLFQVLPFFVALALDYMLGWTFLRSAMGIFSIVYSIFQFLWYGRCVHIHQLFLLNSYSNIDNCDMKWYLKAQMPVFLLSLLYYPLCVLPEATWPSILYDLLTMGFMMYLVAMISLHEMDDRAYSLIEKIDFRKSKTEIFDAAIREAHEEVPDAMPAAKPVAPAASGLVSEAQPSTPVAEETPATAPAPEAPKEWTRVEKESFDFGDQMKKLEEDEFFLDPDVNIDYLANKLGTNRHYVSNYLNQILKMPFYVYVNKLRLEYAERMLRTSNDKASSIGYLCGFNSEGTFRRLFKEQYGCTPTQYVKKAAA